MKVPSRPPGYETFITHTYQIQRIKIASIKKQRGWMGKLRVGGCLGKLGICKVV